MGWLSGWLYRKEITLSRASGAVANYQMKLPVGESGLVGNDPYTVSLLHMDTSFVDSAKGGAKTWTPNGNAQITTAQSKFGGASGVFDGTGDFVRTPYSPDFDFGTGNFTIDFWVRFNALPSSGNSFSLFVVARETDNNNIVTFYLNNGAGVYRLYFVAIVGGSTKAAYNSPSWAVSTNTWYHLALVRSGSTIYIFINGVLQSLTETVAIGSNDITPAVNEYTTIGRNGNYTGYDFNGWFDEFRVSKGIARWTSGFTPFVLPYADVSMEENGLSTFNDLRFTAADGETLLDYWIESITGSTPNGLATVWVEFDSIGTGATTFYMYYGKAGASAASNGANTFIVFDDFERGNDGDVVGGAWTVVSGDVKISTEHAYSGTRCAKILGGATSAGATIPVTSSDNIAIRFRAWKENAALQGIQHGDGGGSGWSLASLFEVDEDISIYDGASYLVKGVGTPDSWRLFEFNDFVWASALCDLWYEGAKLADNADISYAAATYANKFQVNGFGNSAGNDWYLDDLIVRNYRTTEPVWGSWGAEEEETGLPGQASNPDPAHLEEDVAIDKILSWTAGSGATSHDVYFGTSSPPDFIGNQPGVTYDPGPLDYEEVYYWRIDEVNDDGTTEGDEWSFTTEEEEVLTQAMIWIY